MSKSAEKILKRLYDNYQNGNEWDKALKDIELYAKSKEADVLEAILDDIDFGYDASMIKGKIESKSYTNNYYRAIMSKEKSAEDLANINHHRQLTRKQFTDDIKARISQKCKEVEIDYEEQLQQAYDEIQALQESADDYIDTLNTQIRGLRD